VIVLLTDGENNQNPDPLEAAKAAADQGVRIYTVGIGTAAGSDLDIEGFKVHSQLDEAMLKQIASVTTGRITPPPIPAPSMPSIRGSRPGWSSGPSRWRSPRCSPAPVLLVLLVGGAASLVWLGRAP
jgi:Ca-activated chloride channel family protein